MFIAHPSLTRSICPQVRKLRVLSQYSALLIDSRSVEHVTESICFRPRVLHTEAPSQTPASLIADRSPSAALIPARLSTSEANGLDSAGIVDHESCRSRGREFYAHQIASRLPDRWPLEAGSSWPKKKLKEYEKRRDHKTMVNRLLKDSGPLSHDWSQPLERLMVHTVFDEPAVTSVSPPVLRGVQSKSQRVGLRKSTHPPARPESWTENNFTAYMEELMALRPTRPLTFEMMNPAHDSPEKFSREGIADTLDELVHSPSTRNFLTVELCNLVLQYFYAKSMMHRARALYIRMEHLEMHVSTPTFNILLRGSAAQHDLRNFAFLLDNMIKRGMRPNAHTWTAFLMTIESKEVREVVVNEMVKRGLLNNKSSSKKEVVPLLINYEISNHLDANQDLSTFFRHMSHRYGKDWLSTSVGNAMLSEIGRQLSVAESLGVLHELKQHAFAANEITMNAMLSQSAWVGKVDLATEILYIFDYYWGLKPQRVAHEIMFDHAWNGQRLNLARAVWVSACLQGCVSFHMQNSVMQSLLSAIRSEETTAGSAAGTIGDTQLISQRSTFKQEAGQFILRLELSQIDYDIARCEPMQPQLRKSSRHQIQIEAAKFALRRNLATAGQGRLRNKVSDIFRDALALDRLWEAAESQRLAGLSWKMQNVLPIDIEVMAQTPRQKKVEAREALLAVSRLRKKSGDYGTSILSPLHLRDLARLATKPPKELTFRFGSRKPKTTLRLNPRRRRSRKRTHNDPVDSENNTAKP